MKVFVILAVVAAASANPQLLLNNNLWGLHHGAVAYSTPVVSHQVVAPLATKTQYHAQSENGEASFGYAYPGQAQAEVRDAAGNVRGSYAYVNPNGKHVQVQYTAGHDGFRVASNDLPVAPVNTHVPVVANLVAPSPVQDTVEVQQARAAHALAHQEALARSGRKKRQILTTSAVLPTTALGYSNVLTHPVNTVALSNVNAWGYTAPVWNNAVTTPVVSHAVTNQVWNNAVTTPVVTGYAAGYTAPVVSSVVSQPVREATLTKVVNTPGHAVSYRVD